ASAFFIAVFSLATSSGEALAGRKKANHSLCAMFLMPCSPKVGTSGAKRLRLAPDTPRMRTLPDCRLRDVADGARHRRDVAAQQVEQGRLRAAVGRVLELAASLLAQQRADEVRRGARGRRAVVGAGRVGLGPGEELGHGLDGG